MAKRRINRVLALTGEERKILAEAVLVVTIVRVSLLLFGAGRTIRWVGHPEPDSTPASSQSDADMIRAVTVGTRRAARLVPGASCLTQAIAARILLRRRGQSSSLRIGVARPAAGGLHAHAWLEVGDATVIGHFAGDAYVRLSGNEVFD